MIDDIAHPVANPWYAPMRLLLMFLAGFLAVLTFHQGMFAILYGLGIIPVPPYPTAPTWPFDVPKFISLAFWGGVWGLIFAWVEAKFPRNVGYWIAAFLFGAVFPTLVAFFVVLPLKGHALTSALTPEHLMIGFLLNGAWGVGTACIYRLLARGPGRTGGTMTP